MPQDNLPAPQVATNGAIVKSKSKWSCHPITFLRNLFKRKDDSLITPAYQFFISFSNYSFQIVVPCFKKDKQLDGKRFSFRAIPTPLDFSQSIKGSGLLDFSSHEPIKNQEAPIQMHFEFSEMSIGEIK